MLLPGQALAQAAAGTPAAAPEADTADESRGPSPVGPFRGAAGRRLSVESGVALSASHSELRGTPGALRDGAEWGARIEPTLNLNLRSAAVQASLAYAMSAQANPSVGERGGSNSNAGGGSSRAVQNTLNAQLAARFDSSWGLDARAAISQQARSAFDRQAAPDSDAAAANRVEVGSLTIAPSFRTPLGDWATVDLRLSAAGTNARDSTAGDSTTLGGDLTFSSRLAGAFGWSLGLSRQEVDYRASRETTSERAVASLSWRPDVDWDLALRGGRERTDIGGLDLAEYANWGFSLRWTPTPRTELAISEDRRHFGNSWNASAQHRTPRTVWRVASSRGTAGGANAGATAGSAPSTTAYQLMFAQFASRIPDPVERDRAVRDFLLALDIDPNSLVTGGQVNGAITLQQREEASVAWTGRRGRVLLSAFQSESQVLDTVASGTPNPGPTQLWGWNVVLGWQLTPVWSVSLNGSRQVARGNDLNAGNDLKSVSASLSGRLTRQATLSVNGRYSVFNSTRDPYRETSLGASLGVKF
jgi:uncharacterized protein (PEP-CTERM system associated)